MRRALQVIVFCGMILFAGMLLPAQSIQSATEPAPPEQTYNPIPRRLIWPGIVIIILIGIFVAAALAGPIIRANHDDPDSPAPPDQTS